MESGLSDLPAIICDLIFAEWSFAEINFPLQISRHWAYELCGGVTAKPVFCLRICVCVLVLCALTLLLVDPER